MSLRRTVRANMYKMKTTEGSSFYGQFTDIPNTTRVSNFNSARRLLRVPPKSILRAGKTFRDPNGQVFLLAEHGDQFLQGEPLYTHYKLFEMTNTATVGNKGAKTQHPVSKLEIEGDPVWTDPIWLAFEIRSSGSDQMGVNIKRQQVITGHSLQEGDLIQITDYDRQAVVKQVDKQLGVYIGQIEYE